MVPYGAAVNEKNLKFFNRMRDFRLGRKANARPGFPQLNFKCNPTPRYKK